MAKYPASRIPRDSARSPGPPAPAKPANGRFLQIPGPSEQFRLFPRPDSSALSDPPAQNHPSQRPIPRPEMNGQKPCTIAPPTAHGLPSPTQGKGSGLRGLKPRPRFENSPRRRSIPHAFRRCRFHGQVNLPFLTSHRNPHVDWKQHGSIFAVATRNSRRSAATLFHRCHSGFARQVGPTTKTAQHQTHQPPVVFMDQHT